MGGGGAGVVWWSGGWGLVAWQAARALPTRCPTFCTRSARNRYRCRSLHGGKDQSDRESTIVDFKQNVCNILVATSGALSPPPLLLLLLL